jgi:hypothetical protein
MCLAMGPHAGSALDAGGYIQRALNTRIEWAGELDINLEEYNSRVITN